MAVKAKQRAETSKKFYVGFTSVKVVAINPSRKELNKLIGKEDSADDKPIEYASTDNGVERMRVLFCMKDDKNDQLFFYSFNMTNKERKNKAGDKCQIVNQTCTTSWLPYIKKGDEVTSKLDESVVQDWFVNFTDLETKQILGAKKWRKALAGEEELVTLMRTWLGRADWYDPETEVFVDTKKIFNQNFKELRELISLDEEGKFHEDGLDSPFVILLGVRTDEEDSTKKYQQVYSKGFLPNSYMKFINNGMKFPNDKTKKNWEKFKEAAEGDYGFDGYTELVPLTEYDASKDPTGGKKTGTEAPVPQDSNY